MSRAQRQHRQPDEFRLGWTSPDDEECELQIEASPGQPLIQWGESAQPGYGPSFRVLAVAELDGTPRPDLIAIAERDLDRIEREALDLYQDRYDAAAEDAAEARADLLRDR